MTTNELLETLAETLYKVVPKEQGRVGWAEDRQCLIWLSPTMARWTAVKLEDDSNDAPFTEWGMGLLEEWGRPPMSEPHRVDENQPLRYRCHLNGHPASVSFDGATRAECVARALLHAARERLASDNLRV
jgi:hypothetical protein